MQPLVLAIAITHRATAATPVSFHQAKNTVHPQHQGEYGSPGGLSCCSFHSEHPASNTAGQRMGLYQFREGSELYSRLSFFLPLWLTPPSYKLYVLCGWKTELISHQYGAALVSKICFCVQNQLPPSPRDLSATTLISQEDSALAQVDLYRHLIRCIRKKPGAGGLKTKGTSSLCLSTTVRACLCRELLPPVHPGKGRVARRCPSDATRWAGCGAGAVMGSET